MSDKKNKCDKKRYASKLDAKIALSKIAAKDSSKRGSQEKRAYHCEKCRCWHLTSKTKRKGTTKK